MLAFFGQMLCVSDPAAPVTRARRLVMMYFANCRLDELDAFAQGSGESFDRHFFEFSEVLETGFPAAAFTGAMVASLSGGFKKVLVLVVVFFDSVLDQHTGIGEGFDELFPHDFLLLHALIWICHILPPN